MRDRPLTRGRRAVLGCVLAASSVPVVASACSSSANQTVMVVSVSSDLTVGSELDKIEIVAASGELKLSLHARQRRR